MSRWLRVIRGMIGMGLTFAAAAAVFFGVLAVVSGLFFPGATRPSVALEQPAPCMWPSPEPSAEASQKPMTAVETARGWGGMEYTFRS